MTKPATLILLLIAALGITGVLGCKSASKGKQREEKIAAFEVRLTTATNASAGAVAELALVVDYKGPPQPFRQSHEFGRKQYAGGETKTIKVKSTGNIPWKNRSQITFYISTRSTDGLLPSTIWIAAVSDQGERFTMRNVDWKHRMLSAEPNEPEATGPVEAAREWVVPLFN